MSIYFKSVAVFFVGGVSAFAGVEMPAFFSDGMVLQQETGAKVWGFGDVGEGVEVSFAGQKLSSKVGDDGMWEVNFKGLKANGEGGSMTVVSSEDERVINDVVVGEVWIASGQSNMEWSVKKTDSAEEAKTAEDDLLRIYVSGNVTAAEPVRDFKGSWKKTSPENNQGFTAVGYEFAKKLRAELGVPVGVIECAWGGKPVEAFMSDEAMRKIPEAQSLVDSKAKQMKAWEKKKQAEAKPAKDDVIDKPKPKAKVKKPTDPALNSRLHSTIYNGMIAPIAGYGVRGAIWYQGESNANGEIGPHYGELLNGMILDWREKWGSELSFYYVQLANFERGGNLQSWVVVQDEMRRLLDECDGVGMAVINDIGSKNDIHPRNKKDVGLRLARWALHRDYGKKDVVVSGPLYKSHVVKGNAVEVSFSYSEGMKARAGKVLGGFELSDAEGKWFAADAMVVDGKVVVSSDEVPEPSNVRYAWKSDPVDANLVNGEGLPTSCFVGK
jgi:sialate O-acetylesterase